MLPLSQDGNRLTIISRIWPRYGLTAVVFILHKECRLTIQCAVLICSDTLITSASPDKNGMGSLSKIQLKVCTAAAPFQGCTIKTTSAPSFTQPFTFPLSSSRQLYSFTPTPRHANTTAIRLLLLLLLLLFLCSDSSRPSSP